jgi:peptidyl-prolyl cis-trans isomerase C
LYSVSIQFRWLIGILLCGIQVYAQSPANPNSPAVQPKISPDAVVLTIGSTKITAKEAEDFVGALPPQYRNYFAGPGKPQVPDLILRNKLLAQEAERRGLDKDGDVPLKLRIARESILVAAVEAQIERENPVSEEVATQYLNDNKNIFEEAHIKRILIAHKSSIPTSTAQDLPSKEEAQAQANDIRKKLVEAGDFEEQASKFSNDMLTSGKGGDAGFIRRASRQINQAPKQGQIPIAPPVEDVIFSIPVGSISEVIDAPFGFEIIQVVERRIPKVADVKKEIETRIRTAKMADLLKGLKEKTQIKIEPGYFSR